VFIPIYGAEIVVCRGVWDGTREGITIHALVVKGDRVGECRDPDMNLMDELFKFLPTLLVIGALIWTSRNTMRSIGAGISGGRGRNIFNVGKAQVRYPLTVIEVPVTICKFMPRYLLFCKSSCM
jgi:hypothetical protein